MGEFLTKGDNRGLIYGLLNFRAVKCSDKSNKIRYVQFELIHNIQLVINNKINIIVSGTQCSIRETFGRVHEVYE